MRQKPSHGLVIPLFSLRTQQSCGIGEFLDLLPLINWCSQIGLDLIQLLPIQDTGDEASPYYPLSSCALDPIYLSLASLPSSLSLKKELQLFAPLSSLPALLRDEVKHKKIEWLFRYFTESFDLVKKEKSYQEFVTAHSWLLPYAKFKASKEMTKQIDFHCFIQYLCFQQMGYVRKIASKRNVFLIGDLPISINPDSADVFEKPELFDLTLSAGAPPDIYNALGQSWGFPIFRWDQMRKNGYTWWKRRMSVMQELFHFYRIDHVVGFFRIWAIKEGQKPSQGFFLPEDPSSWISQGREILKMLLASSPLFPIAEDLGTIPKGVPQVLKELHIPGTKVFLWQQRNKKPIPYSSYDPESATTLSTPDSEPLAIMWEKYPDLSAPFAQMKGWNYPAPLTREQRLSLLSDAHSTASRFHLNLLQETLALFPELSWENPEQDRINIPGTVLKTNWTYRFRPTVEEIVCHKGLAEVFKSYISAK